MLSDLWRAHVYDSTHAPIKFDPHPHSVYSPLARFLCALLGSIVPVGAAVIHSGVLKQLDQGQQELGYVFWGVLITFIAIWLISVILVTAAEGKTLPAYIVMGSMPPANIVLILKAYVTLQ